MFWTRSVHHATHTIMTVRTTAAQERVLARSSLMRWVALISESLYRPLLLSYLQPKRLNPSPCPLLLWPPHESIINEKSFQLMKMLNKHLMLSALEDCTCFTANLHKCIRRGHIVFYIFILKYINYQNSPRHWIIKNTSLFRPSET